jgi:hypothetical protein
MAPDVGVDPVAQDLEKKCSDELREYFKDPGNPGVKDFLQFQSQLTLHRLTWMHLKYGASHPSGDRKPATERVEQMILELLTHGESGELSKNAQFVQAMKEFRNQPLSRPALAKVAQFLPELLRMGGVKTSKGDELFLLQDDDLKLLHLVSEYDRKRAGKGAYSESYNPRAHNESAIFSYAHLVNESVEGKFATGSLGKNQREEVSKALEKQILQTKQRAQAEVDKAVRMIQACREIKSSHENCTNCTENAKKRNLEAFANEMMDLAHKGLEANSTNGRQLAQLSGSLRSSVKIPDQGIPGDRTPKEVIGYATVDGFKNVNDYEKVLKGLPARRTAEGSEKRVLIHKTCTIEVTSIPSRPGEYEVEIEYLPRTNSGARRSFSGDLRSSYFALQTSRECTGERNPSSDPLHYAKDSAEMMKHLGSLSLGASRAMEARIEDQVKNSKLPQIARDQARKVSKQVETKRYFNCDLSIEHSYQDKNPSGSKSPAKASAPPKPEVARADETRVNRGRAPALVESKPDLWSAFSPKDDGSSYRPVLRVRVNGQTFTLPSSPDLTCPAHLTASCGPVMAKFQDALWKCRP